MSPDECIVRVAVFDEFKFSDGAVLLAVNNPGVDAVLHGLREARRHQSATIDCSGRTHTFEVHAGAADVELPYGDDTYVCWRLDPSTLAEITEKLAGMQRHPGMGHHYVDGFHTPKPTLVISVDEYLVPNAVLHTSPFGYF